MINALQDTRTWADCMIFNPGGYTCTSVALRDAISAIGVSVVDVHVYAHEEFRYNSLLSAVCKGKILGFGWKSYMLGLYALVTEFD